MNEKQIYEKIKAERDISFLTPSIQDLKSPRFSPSNIINIEQVKEMIDIHRRFNSKILIFTDYDVDGITGGFMLYDFLKKNGANVETMISNRKLGYGLSNKEVKKIINSNYELVITVDCGISDKDHIKTLENNGIDVIVTDHHESKNPPDCLWINPKAGNKYFERNLSGAGVVFKLISYLLEDVATDYLDILAIANIADFVPLLGENRIQTRLGLQKINRNPYPSVKTMLDTFAISDIDESTIAYQIAPAINSINRLDYSDIPMEILKGNNIQSNTRDMIDINNFRKRQISNTLDNLDYNTNNNIIIAQGEFKQGYTGLIASKLKDRHKLPSIVLNQNLRGSARSIEPLDITSMLQEENHLFESVGGHKLASGFKLKEGNVDKLKEIVYNKCEGIKYKTINVDIELENLSPINTELMTMLDNLRPFGAGNPSPLFRIRNIELDDYTPTRTGEHIQMEIQGKRGIWFFADLRQELRQELDITFEIQRDDFRGKGIQLIIKEVQNANN